MLISLHNAAKNGDTDFINHYNDEIDIKDNNGDTALRIAISSGQTSAAKLLIDKKANLNITGGMFGWTPLIIATYSGQIDTVKMLIDAGADLNIVDNSGNTALMTAAKKEKYEIAEMLIKSGADLNIQNNAGQTAIMLTEDMEIEDLLRKSGAVYK